MSTIADLLIRLRDPYDLDGCAEAIKWLGARDGTLEQAWDACERGDWMLWLADRVGLPSPAYCYPVRTSGAPYSWDAWSDDGRRAAIAVRQHITGAMIVALLDAHAVTP